MESIRKAESFRDYRKLNLQEEFLSKSLSSAIKALRIGAELTIGDAESLKASGQRGPRKSAVCILEELKQLKSTLLGSGPSDIRNLDVKDCGSRLTKLAKKIEGFKAAELRLVLAREEESLDSELRDLEKAIFSTRTIARPAAANRKCPTRAEVNDKFTELVARTGHTQGWTAEDHSVFLKARLKWDSVPRLVNEVRKRRPHLTNEEIVNHEAWQKLYTELRDKRKREIAEWRSKNGGVSSAGKASETRTEPRRVNSEKNNRKRLMIEEWRAERLRKSRIDEEQKKIREKAKIEGERRRRDAEREKAVNRRDEKAREISEEEGRQRRTTEERRDSIRYSKRLISSFRDQDERFVRRRLDRLRVSEDSISQRELSRLKPRCSTLLKPTKVWEERCKRDAGVNKSENLFDRVNYVKDIKRLHSAAGWKCTKYMT